MTKSRFDFLLSTSLVLVRELRLKNEPMLFGITKIFVIQAIRIAGSFEHYISHNDSPLKDLSAKIKVFGQLL